MKQAGLDHLSRDPGNWHLYLFYFCRRDPRLIVPKRIRGLGWTINLAHLSAFLLVGLIAGAVLGILQFARSCGVGGETMFGLKLFLAFALMVLCHRLSRPRI